MGQDRLGCGIYRGLSKNRGVHPIDFTIPVKLPKPGDVAFGVNIAAGKVQFRKFKNRDFCLEDQPRSGRPVASNQERLLQLAKKDPMALHPIGRGTRVQSYHHS
ncbi:unnamed protein product [Heligmosomoides polygyrus]|uniref:SPRY domain-containing protein n=1 Tax=Heligmosomoides polygyrus TaxID=6339 RepID=A0A183G0Z9_HELPZ|nr:unnamed protein product [Heligmosomoides polygyrus]